MKKKIHRIIIRYGYYSTMIDRIKDNFSVITTDERLINRVCIIADDIVVRYHDNSTYVPFNQLPKWDKIRLVRALDMHEQNQLKAEYEHIERQRQNILKKIH